MKKALLVFAIALAFGTTAMAADIAISTHAGWFGQAAADREMQEIVDNVTGVSIEVFPSDQQDALADWVRSHTGDGVSDLLIMCGQFPATIYAPGNAQTDGSIAELFLDDGNTIINTGDYMFYVVNGAGTNGEGGIRAMMDNPSITMWDDDTAVTVTAEGREFTPTLVDFATDRPFHLNELQGDWVPELIMAQNASGTRADPVIVLNTATGGRLGIFYQTAGQDNDPRGEVISEWINNWWIPNVAVGNPLARRPDPEDGAMFEATWGNLMWQPGDWAVSHDLYIGTNFEDVNSGAADTFVGNLAQPTQIIGFVGFPFPDGLVPGTTYYWRVDEVNDANAASPWKGNVWSFWVPSKKAYGASVADGAKFVTTDAKLAWTAGFGARLHHVYFGDDLDTVTNAVGALPQTTTTFNPGPLEEDKTYYWRVDEFDGAAVHTGDVWSFTTVPTIAVGDPALVAWWKLDEGGGTTVVDWSGHGNHGALIGDSAWIDGYELGALDFDGGGDYVDFADTSDLPSGTAARTLCGWGRTETVTGGWRWIAAYGTAGTSQAMFIGMNGTSLYGGGYGDDVPLNGLSGFWYVGVWHHICLTYDGTVARLYADGVEVASEAKTWDLPLNRAHIGRQVNNAAEFWNGQIDDVRIYNKALTVDEIQQVIQGNTKLAANPVPDRDAVVDIRDISSLSWSKGDTAASHDVYFGTDRDALELKGNQAGTSLSLAGLVEFGGGDYYWRVNEVEAAGAVNAGTIWKFTVPAHLIVDDIESYNDIPETDPGSNRVYLTWIDGFGTTNNGAIVGNLDVPLTERVNVHGGAQAMPYSYDNNLKTSEATMTLPAGKRNWTEHGVTKLSLWFRGSSANAAERMFVALNGNAVVYHPDAGVAQTTRWTEWVIDLAAFGIDLSNVNTVTIGFGTKNSPAAGGTGTMYFDDIVLTR